VKKTASPLPLAPQAIAEVRRFTRTYTRQTGLLRSGLYGSELSLTEARLLYELATGGAAFASDLVDKLVLDRSHVSRILARFERKGLITRTAEQNDRRRARLRLSAKGKALFKMLNRQSDKDVAALLGKYPPDLRAHLVKALAEAEAILSSSEDQPVSIREYRIGDLGWIIHRQAVLYHREYGWNGEFGGLLADVVGSFVREFKAEREGCWMAERGGAILGSVMLVDAGQGIAKLRLLYLEPEARGLGLGGRLVDHCVAFARERNYRRLVLWTNDVLTAARAVYKKRGFVLTGSEKHNTFGHDLIGETWEKDLSLPEAQP